MKPFKSKIREKLRKDGTIIIKTILDVVENPKDCFTNKEKRLSITINRGLSSIFISFPYTKKGKNDLIKFIKKEFYL